MTSERPAPTTAYVWVWLPGAVAPVVCGQLVPARTRGRVQIIDFAYGRRYLARDDALPLYLPELPLVAGRLRPLEDLTIAGAIADAGPDTWGRRVVLRLLTGSALSGEDLDGVDELSYLLLSGSDRTGAIDFQTSSAEYVPRGGGTLEDLVAAAGAVDEGAEIRPDLRDALLGGSSLGGARPKVSLHDGDRHLIVKLSSRTDTFPIVRAEALAMELARRVGINTATSWLGDEVLGRDALFVERFDRAPGGRRHMMVSALTLLGLPAHAGRHATYVDLADVIVERFTAPTATLHELFRRIVFNICISNTDDHARNHAALWHPPAAGEGAGTAPLTLTPAYDLEPQNRSGGEAAQAMAYGPGGARLSRLAGCVEAAEIYRLTRTEARDTIDALVDVIRSDYDDAADLARLTRDDRDALFSRQILNPYAFDGY